MRAKKSNKSYMIEEREAKKFQSKGFDIYDDEGNLILIGAGKMISAEKYMELLTAYNKVVEELESLKKKSSKKKEKEEVVEEVE